MRKQIVTVFDDLTGEPIVDNDVHRVDFSYEGRDYVMDLNEKNFVEFEEKLSGYIAVAHRKPKRSTKKPSTTKRAPNTAEKRRREKIRVWAVENNLNMGNRGRISQKIVDLYERAHDNE